MKSTQLLSVVLSLIMFTGVTTGNVAFADSHELDDQLEYFCEITSDEQSAILSDNGLDEYAEDFAAICEIEDEDEREDKLELLIDELGLDIETEDEVIDDFEDCVEANGTVVENECTYDDMVFVNDDDDNDDSNDIIDSFEDCVEAGFPVMESYPEQCKTDDGTVFVNDEDDDDDVSDDREKVLVCHKGKKTLSIDDHALRAHLSHGDYEGACDGDWTRADYMHDKYSNKGQGNLHDRFAMHCDLASEEREERIAAMHDDLPDDFRADLARYCEMTDEEQDDFRDKIMDHMDVMMDRLKDKMHTDIDMRKHMDRFCAMSEDEQQAYLEENEKPQDKAEKILKYCSLDEDGRAAFIEEHRDEYRAHMKDKIHDKMGMYSDRMHDYKSDKKHMDYDRLCSMADSDRALEITDVAKLDRISDWCEMTPAEREDYKREHYDEIKDKMHDKKEKHHEKMVKFSEKSDRLRAMIMDKRDISDERADEIRMKFEAKFGEDSDKKRSEIKMKYKEHFKHMKFYMSDERRADVHDRLAEMKAYKAELREKSSEMSDEEKQQLREEFIEKAKDMQLAWISPRTQITAGVDPTEVECREGFSLVMKASNGVAMCLKADTALKMIDRGIVVPAN